MHRTFLLFFLICSAEIVATGPAATAQEPPAAGLEIAGSVQHPTRYTAQSLVQLAPTTRPIMFFTGHGPVSAVVKGVSVWEILQAAGIATDPKDKDPSLRKYLVATGADGYRVILALAEMDPKFGAGEALVAFEQDGKPIAGGLRLIVPSDKAGGRNVSRLVRLEVDELH